MFFFQLLYEKRSLAWALFIIAFAMLIYGLFVPQVRSELTVNNVDKLMHLSAFFLVFLLGRFATHSWVKQLYWILPYGAAVSLEYFQGVLVVTRQFSYADMTANLIGVTAAAGLWMLLVMSGQLNPVGADQENRENER